MPANTNSGPEKKQAPAFTSPPSTRAIALVAIAILIGFLLVLIVDSDNDTDTTAKKDTTTTTTTVAPNNDDESETSTTRQVDDTNDPSEVSVLVLNGSNIAGIAGTTTEGIADAEYRTLTAGNSETKATDTVVYYKSGFENDAEQIASNVLPGILSDLDITQEITTDEFPNAAPVGWDPDNLVAANIVIVVGNP